MNLNKKKHSKKIFTEEKINMRIEKLETIKKNLNSIIENLKKGENKE